MHVREWPAGHRLFSEGGFHLSFDPPGVTGMPAVLLTIDTASDTLTILAVEVFRDDDTALAWFAEQRKQRSH